MAAGLHISISAETLLNVGGIAITNSMLTSLVVSGLIIAFAIIVRLQLKDTNSPRGLQNFAEWIVESLHNLVHSVTGDLKKTRLFLPFIGTFLLWILFNNWLGLLPGVGTIRMIENSTEVHEAASAEKATEGEMHSSVVGQVYAVEGEEPVSTHEEVLELVVDEGEMHLEESDDTHMDVMAGEVHEELEQGAEEHHVKAVPIFRPGTADLNTTIALALVSVFLTQVFGVQALGLSYFKKYINFSNPIMTFVGFLETISEFAKVISFAFRLFGNIFAGEVLLVVISSLVPIIAPMPFYGLELFVGFIQALVFAMLSLVFFNMATQSHDEH
ncbi:MAG: F0F1 ATP synthase subunit A [Pseudomonadales bacterium]|nr:F0F1 ATP synthase subunit A [Candidatus Woesebacteria bacterium]MCB9800706.1 F0F1 ATP synthase subunit A [Pseudomonadales bacterium]